MAIGTRIALIGIVLASAVMAWVLTASATPTPTDYDPSTIFDDTYNDYASAQNITNNSSADLLYFLDCGAANDYDFLYVWLPPAMDLSFHFWFNASIVTTRTDVWLRDSDHFNLVHASNIGGVGPEAWLNTTTRVAGPYYLVVGRCVNNAEYYNVSWTATATASGDDLDNSLADARPIVDGLMRVNGLTETTDQADFFKIDVVFTPPARRYLQLTTYTTSASIQFEFYNSTGAVLSDPLTHEGLDPASAAAGFAAKAFRFPAPGTYYIRMWSGGLTSTYTIVFGVVDYTPSVTYLDTASALTTADDFTISNAQNYSFEGAHYYKIHITTPRTIWVDATSNQIDIQAQLKNESLIGTYFQKRLSRHPYDDLASPKDHESFNFTVTASELAASTGWYYIIIAMDSDLPPEGLYTVKIWLNDAPAGLIVPRTLLEDNAVVDFDTRTLFTDLDCTLNAADPDCALTISLLNGTAANLTFDFVGGRWLNVTPDANWSGSGCRLFRATDAKGLNATGTLCVTVTEVNDPPALTGVNLDQYTILEDGKLVALRIQSWFFDVDGDAMTYAVTGNGSIRVTIDQLTGLADFVPAANFNGFVNITFNATDSRGASVEVVVEFYVVPVNDPPEARGAIPQVTVAEDNVTQFNLNTLLIFGTPGVFTDIDGNPLTYLVYDAVNLSVTVLGPVVSITPEANFAGLASFNIVAFDGVNESSKAGVLVRVTPVNDNPSIVTATPTTNPINNEGEARVFTITAADVDRDTLSYQWYVNGVGIVAATRANYTFATQVTDELARSATVRVVVSDGNGGTADREWTVTILNTNQAPRQLTTTSPTKTTFTSADDITFSATALDPDNDTLTWTWYSDRLATPIGVGQSVTAKLPSGVNHIRLVVSDGALSVESTMNLTVSEAPPPPKPPGFEGPAAIAGLAAVAALAVGLRHRRRGE